VIALTKHFFLVLLSSLLLTITAFSQRGAIEIPKFLELLRDDPKSPIQSFESLFIAQMGGDWKELTFNIDYTGDKDLSFTLQALFGAPNNKNFISYTELILQPQYEFSSSVYGAGYLIGALLTQCYSLSSPTVKEVGDWFGSRIESIKNARGVSFTKKFGKVQIDLSVEHRQYIDYGSLVMEISRFDLPATTAWARFCTIPPEK
jgi:hypothetical protein